VRYNLGEQCYDYIVYRTTNATGCVTEAYGKLYYIDHDNLRAKTHSTDGKCELNVDFNDEFTYTRMQTKG
jgi:hypothetical protein